MLQGREDDQLGMRACGMMSGV
eukprot:COSAG04_NODE_29729_length_267_cov_0.619048_1_plen_21_part_01